MLHSNSNVTSERNLFVSHKQKQVAQCRCCLVCGPFMRMWELVKKRITKMRCFFPSPACLRKKRVALQYYIWWNWLFLRSLKGNVSMIVRAPIGRGKLRLARESQGVKCSFQGEEQKTPRWLHLFLTLLNRFILCRENGMFLWFIFPLQFNFKFKI